MQAPVETIAAVLQASPDAAKQPGEDGRRGRLYLKDNCAIGLGKEEDATHGHRCFTMRLVSPDQAIEVEFAKDGAVVVVGRTGFSLDNWHGNREPGNRQNFSTWNTSHQWQLNQDTMTLSPKGSPNLVLGWNEQERWAQLVAVGDTDHRITYVPLGGEHKSCPALPRVFVIIIIFIMPSIS